MSLEKVQQAFISQLAAAFPTWATRIAWENKNFSATQGQAWMAFHFVPAGESIDTLSVDGLDRVDGFVQIDVNYPQGIGEGESRKTINALRTCFKPGYLTYGGQSVLILSRSRAGGMTSDGFFKIPFTVRWRAQITRSA